MIKTNLAKCVDNKNYEVSLQLGKIYKVIINGEVANGRLLVIDESGESYYYDLKMFILIP